MKESEVDAKLRELEFWIQSHQPEALREFKRIFGIDSIHKMHAHFGRNNNTFVDSIRTQFTDPKDFIARWIVGLKTRLEEIRSSGKLRYQNNPFGEEIVLRCLQEEPLRKYVLNFLARNFYRNFNARVRAKPTEDLWSIWFGAGNLCWGLVIAPSFRNAQWTNDKSQMRREAYQYWTIGHVLATGIIDPESQQPLRFNSVNDFAIFYRSVLKRVSNSLYEKGISDRYLAYLSQSENPLDEPLLIPELRYAGRDKKHEHRLDFSVLNGHTSTLTGYELSPASTHIAVEGMKAKSQKAVNAELASAWQKEVSKRNDYFEKFGIHIITFADTNLADLDGCFLKMKEALALRNAPKISVKQALSDLGEFATQGRA
jgi:hypothetical protein